MKNIPALDSKVLDLVTEISKEPKVEAAMAFIKDQTEVAMLEQIELCEIEAPTFHERAASVAERMRQYGLTDVHIDEIGNVIGIPGYRQRSVLAIGAHMDSVFPAGTDVKVKRGNIYRAPGIGDNCSGLRALLQVLRAMEKKTSALWAISGLSVRSAKRATAIFAAQSISVLTTSLTVLSRSTVRTSAASLYGAVGSHRWRLAVDGTGGHSFADFGKTPSAIHAVCRAGNIIADIKVPEDPKTTFTIGTIKGRYDGQHDFRSLRSGCGYPQRFQ